MRQLFRFGSVGGQHLRRECHLRHYKVPKPGTPPSPPKPPKPPKKPQKFEFHGITWEDPYSWMSNLNDKVAMRHMDVYMEQEEKYTEAVMSDTERLQSKLQSEMATRMAFELSTPPLRWGPWSVSRFSLSSSRSDCWKFPDFIVKENKN